MKKIITLTTLFLILLGVSSLQNKSTYKTNSILFENKSIKIIGQLKEYKSPSRSVIKNFIVYTITNKTNKNIKLTYSKEAYYNGKCSSCGSLEAQFTIILNKKETKIGQCSDRLDRSLKTFHSFKSGESNSVLTDLKLTNIKIEKI